MTKPTGFLVDHIYALPLSRFLHFYGLGDNDHTEQSKPRAAYDHRLDKESFRKLLLALKWHELGLRSPPYESDQVLRRAPGKFEFAPFIFWTR